MTQKDTEKTFDETFKKFGIVAELTEDEWKIMHDFVHLMDRKIDEGESWEYRITYKL